MDFYNKKQIIRLCAFCDQPLHRFNIFPSVRHWRKHTLSTSEMWFSDAALKPRTLPYYPRRRTGCMEVYINASWVIQIPKWSKSGHISCDTVIYHSPVEHWRSARISASGPLTENIGPSQLHYCYLTYMYMTKIAQGQRKTRGQNNKFRKWNIFVVKLFRRNKTIFRGSKIKYMKYYLVSTG